MAGWEQDFDVHTDDVDLFKTCMRIFRRTCARHQVEMTYHLSRVLPSGRHRYVIEYNLHSSDLGIACWEFVIEMRALSLVQTSERRARLPLRLMRDVAFSAVYSLNEQIVDGYVHGIPLGGDHLSSILTDFQTSYWAWAVGVLSDPEFLESQHSTVLQVALLLGENARESDSYRIVVGKLPVPVALQEDLIKLGTRRNRVKHRNKRHEASEYVWDGLAVVWSLSAHLTGFYPDPVPPNVREMVENPSLAFSSPPMFWRGGQPRIVRR